MPVTTAEAQGRMQAKLDELARSGIKRVLLYGAGRHTKKVGEVLADTPLEVIGIIDDKAAGDGARLWGWPIVTREAALRMGAQAVVISSDGAEQSLFEQAQTFESRGVAVHRLYSPAESGAPGDNGTFRASSGHTFTRVPGYRRQVKPGWERMLARKPGEYPVADLDEARANLRSAMRRIELLEKYLGPANSTIKGKDMLEIGCWDGACCAAAVLSGARRCVGIDHQDYFFWNLEPEQITDAMRKAGRESLSGHQEILLKAAVESGLEINGGSGETRVELLVDDINRCDLPAGGFDLICSWQTMEHVIPPERAFATIARLLRPGGVCFAEYGAFTCRKGGHVLCTLDFPWGHIRLGDADVDAYLKHYRPGEYAHAIRHYRRFLNRMTLAEAIRYAEAAGLRLMHKTIWLNRQHFEDEWQPEYLADARRHYPSMTFEDMTHDDVWLLFQKG